MRGELACLVGPNGSGKTTLLSTLAGLLSPLSGEVLVAGKPLKSLSYHELSRSISVVLTNRIQPGYADVYSIVAMGRIPHTDFLGRLDAHDREMVDKAIALCELEELQWRPINMLSDGEMQKVYIARALAQDTAVMILDEPTAFLDMENRAMIVSLLRDLSKKTGKAILGSFHDINLALQAADRLWVLDAKHSLRGGCPEDLVLDGTIERVFAGSRISFRKSSGLFSLIRTPSKEIRLAGKGDATLWTARAMARCGITAKPAEITDFEVMVLESPNGLQWQIGQGTDAVLCSSIAEALLVMDGIYTPTHAI